jgi:hypothetical protein
LPESGGIENVYEIAWEGERRKVRWVDQQRRLSPPGLKWECNLLPELTGAVRQRRRRPHNSVPSRLHRRESHG